jgi:hypothetical protein
LSAFDAIDYTTQEGAKIGRLLDFRLSELRSKLEDVSLSERDTQVVRGGIAEIKRLQSKPAPRVAAPSYSTTPRRGA